MEKDKFWSSIIPGLAALKSTPRTGWTLRGVPASVAESIAAHMHESSVLALILATIIKKEYGVSIDVYKSASIALLHDYAEAYVGDIVRRASRYIGEKTKEEIELKVVREELGENNIAYSLLEEYVRQETVEARVAKVAETLSTLIQGLRYYSMGYHAVKEIICSMYSKLLDMSRNDIAAREALSLVEVEHKTVLDKLCVHTEHS